MQPDALVRRGGEGAHTCGIGGVACQQVHADVDLEVIVGLADTATLSVQADLRRQHLDEARVHAIDDRALLCGQVSAALGTEDTGDAQIARRLDDADIGLRA